MKYVRTKDKKGKQYIISDRDYIFQIKDNKVIFARGYEEELLGQADTIEELFDEFVSITENLTPEILVPKYISTKDTLTNAWKNRFEDELCYENVVIFGAIWTDKGLIYVAKMKGVLPNGEIDWELL